MDILEFYGLKEDPFKLTPDPMYFFPSVSHNEALQSLNYVVQQREGFCLVSGDPGTGKTTLLNVFKENWKDRAEIALIFTPRLSPEEFLMAVLEDLNIRVTSANKNELLRTFRDFLIEKTGMGTPVIIIVDEAQNLPDETLEELRLLSNLETYKDKLLQIILIGQTELEQRLSGANLKQLSQRITVRVRLNPLSPKETLEYMNYRLIKAGRGFLKLDEGLLRHVHGFSAGIPRLINILSSRAIMSAYIEGSNIVAIKHVKYAIRHLKGGVTDKGMKRTRGLLYVVLLYSLLAVILTMAYFNITVPESLITYIPHVTEHKYTGATVIKTGEDRQPVQIPHQEISPEEKPQKSPISERAVKPLKYALVSVTAANVRGEPDIAVPRVGMVYKGDRIEIFGEGIDDKGEKWYKIIMPGDKEGWLSEKVITLTKNP